MTETILVKGWAKEGHESGVLINKSDFNPEIHKPFGATDAPENEFLSRTAKLIIEDLPALNPDELAAYLADEKAGKNRDGVVAAIEKEIASRHKE